MPLYFTFVKYNIVPEAACRRLETNPLFNLQRELNMEVSKFLPLLGRVLIACRFL